MTMICDRCGRVGIRWMGPLSNLTHTECPHCGGRNCQRVDEADIDDEDDDTLPETCRRCNGSGEIGFNVHYPTKQSPGPVPNDAKDWASGMCMDCGGTGVIIEQIGK